jgi:hypothetical protein
MTNPVLDRLTDVQATVLDGIDQARTPATDLAKRAVGVADRIAPDLAPARAKVGSGMSEFIDRQYVFAIELLKRQRAMTKSVAKAVTKNKPAKASPAA